MIVEKIEPINTKRRKISLDNGLVFALYNGEIHRFKIEEGKELLEDSYYEILQTILIKRAKERLAYLIKDGDYTEFQIRVLSRRSNRRSITIWKGLPLFR